MLNLSTRELPQSYLLPERERLTKYIRDRIQQILNDGIHDEVTLAELIVLAFGISIPDKQVCANHSTPWRAFADAYFAKSPVAIWKASRAFGGKTFLLSLLSLVEALTLKADVNLLGGSGEQSKRALNYMSGFWAYDNAPRLLLKSDISREMRFAWGNQVEALMASQASVRGPHPQRVRVDEVDEVDLMILDAALGQPMSKGEIKSQVVLSSTHQYANGTMTECLKRAADKSQPIYEWCYRETLQPHGWLTQDELDRKRSQMSKATWDNEVELQEPSPGTRAIETQAVVKMFDRKLGEYAGEVRQYIEIEPPQRGAKYATGADWARKQDWTIIDTLRVDVTPMRRVAWERLGRESWDAMIDRFEKRVKRYPGSAMHDGTGLGDVVHDRIRVSAVPFIMVGRDRSNLLSEYVAACEHGEIISPYIRFAADSHRLASVDDLYGSGHLPDDICAGALAYRSQSKAGWVRGASH